MKEHPERGVICKIRFVDEEKTRLRYKSHILSQETLDLQIIMWMDALLQNLWFFKITEFIKNRHFFKHLAAFIYINLTLVLHYSIRKLVHQTNMTKKSRTRSWENSACVCMCYGEVVIGGVWATEMKVWENLRVNRSVHLHTGMVFIHILMFMCACDLKPTSLICE